MNGISPRGITAGRSGVIIWPTLSRGFFVKAGTAWKLGVALLLLVTFAATVRGGTLEEVIAEVEKIAGETGLKTALVGFCLIPLDAEPSAAAGYRMDTGLVPASTMKVIATATANELLGPDYRFVTAL